MTTTDESNVVFSGRRWEMEFMPDGTVVLTMDADAALDLANRISPWDPDDTAGEIQREIQNALTGRA